MRRIAILAAFAFVALPSFGGAPQVCQTMNSSNIFIVWLGATSGCTPDGTPCQTAEQINFTAASFGYNFSCSIHTFSWNFGDGSTATGRTPVHSYALPGTYSVTLTVNNSFQTFTTTALVTVTGPTTNVPTLSPAMVAALLLVLTIVAVVRLRG